MSSPTARTLAKLREEGWTAQVVERWNQYARVRQDLFGGIDIVACMPLLLERHFGRVSNVLGIQACAAASHAARREKLLHEPRILTWLRAGARVEIWSWSTRRSLERTKAGKRSKRLVHHLRREEITLAMFVPQEQTRRVELVCMKCGEPWCFHPRPGCIQEQTREAQCAD